MADDGLDELDRDAEGRRRRKGRDPQGGSRNPPSGRGAPTEAEKRDQERRQREEERRKREEARQQREREEEERRRQEEEEHKDSPPPADPPSGDEPVTGEGESSTSRKRRRPTSTPFYPDPDNEQFLWEIQREAVDRQERIPATAVIRLALRRLADQMTPARVVQELGGPVQTNGKMGRPRR